MEAAVVREFAAAREEVYAAWTRAGRFARWFGPRIFATPVERVSLDVRPGGAWEATMVGDEGYEVTFGGVYREVEAPGRLVLTLGEGGGPVSVVTVLLEERGGVTTMRFRQAGDGAEQARAGWVEFFERLDEHLAVQRTSSKDRPRP
ncbi:SRPBCC domain-containing protein [Actinomadura sp. 21ATH]|uniref:SRPBCC family protein n=1 Tax=Actinomadura sp. 21ATH TaxID=1735444 RepID=UPI0035BF561D